MANIYDSYTGIAITQGIEGCTRSAQAIQVARQIATRCEADVLLEDDDGWWTVHPDGSCDETPAPVDEE